MTILKSGDAVPEFDLAVGISGQGSISLPAYKEVLLPDGKASRHLEMATDVASRLGIHPNLASILEGEDEKALVPTGRQQLFIAAHALEMFEAGGGIIDREAIKVAFGLSVGEVIAHVVSGAMSENDLYESLGERGAGMEEACNEHTTVMYALTFKGREFAEDEIKGIEAILSKYESVEVSNYNSAGEMVIGGDEEQATLAFKEIKNEIGCRGIKVKAQGAFHTRWMASAKQRFSQAMEKVDFKDTSIAVPSNFTGDFESGAQAIRRVLVDQITGAVKFAKNMMNVREKIGDAANVLVIGGKPTILQGLVEANGVTAAENIIPISTRADFSAALEKLGGRISDAVQRIVPEQEEALQGA